MRPPTRASAWFILAWIGVEAPMSNSRGRSRLVGGDHGVPAGMVEAGDGLERAGKRHPFVGRLDEVVAVDVDGAVAVEDDRGCSGRHGRARRRIRLQRASLGEVGDAVHRRMQPRQQAEAIGAQTGSSALTITRVEERIDRRLSAAQACSEPA
jgi:hypothetical protein